MRYWIMTFSVILIICLQSKLVYSFESELWPGEGRPVFLAKMDLKVYEKPSKNSGLIKDIKIPKGTKFISTGLYTGL